jgi:tetratricopeptide (TPR) repeat protein
VSIARADLITSVEGEFRHGNFAEAAACCQRALGLFQEVGDRYEQAQALIHLGDAHHAASDPRQARDTWQQARDILDRLHHPDASIARAKLAIPNGRPAPRR